MKTIEIPIKLLRDLYQTAHIAADAVNETGPNSITAKLIKKAIKETEAILIPAEKEEKQL